MSHATGSRWGRSPSLHIALGLVIGQGVIFAVTPLLTRQYSPEAIGAAGVFLAIASIVGSAGTLRMELMVPSASDGEAAWLTRTSTSVLVAVAVTSGLGALLLRVDPLTSFILAITIFGLGATVLTLQISARRKVLSGVASGKAFQGIGQAGVQVGAGVIAQASAWGMPAGYAVGYLLASGVQFLGMRGSRPQPRPPRPSGSERRSAWKRAGILTAAALVNSLAVSFLVLVTQFFFGAEATGQLTIAQRLAVAPVGLLVAALVPLLAAQLGEQIRQGSDVRATVRRWLKRLIPLGVGVGLVLFLVPSEWLVVLLGDEWWGAAQYLRALAPALALQVVVGSLAQVLALQGRSALQFWWDCARLASLVVVCAATAMLSTSAVLTVLMGSMVLAVFYLIYMVLILRRHPSAPHIPTWETQ